MIKSNLFLFVSAFAMLLFMFPAVSSAGDSHFVEEGRFGILAANTDDGVQVGFIRETDSYEFALQADLGWSPKGPNTGNQNGLTGDMGLTLRAGPRINLGDFNYLSYGIQFHDVPWAKDNGLALSNQFDVGPYIGLQRHFPNSHLMLSVWIVPYAYQRQHSNDGAGNQVDTDTHHVFQEGGFGIGYLF